jgi:DNA adenine methylase
MVGGANIVRNMDGVRFANDICPYLIEFYKALQNGWKPPEHVSEEDYKYYNKLYKEGVISPKIGFVMYFCSFGGKKWGGYARDKKTNRDFSKEAYEDSLRLSNGQFKDSLRLSEGIRGVNFYCMEYFDLLMVIPKDCLVYFDIPYKGTTGYGKKFNHDQFWSVIRTCSKLEDIYVSEYEAPEDFECVWQLDRKTNLNTKDGSKSNRTEKIFKYRG